MSESSTPPSTETSRPPSPVPLVAAGEVKLTSSLEDLQTGEQRRILETVSQVRKCGLDSILSLPQLVVCGDQSAGKSSVLEALTGVPFPRNDNTCTRFATEIILRRADLKSLTIKIIPDTARSASEKSTIGAFRESITDFDELPRIMNLAMAVMGIASSPETELKPRAFARDVLSIEISGPKEPQLTLVDIPGLIATSSRGITKADVDMVTEITDHYIAQQRTICLAVVSATNDYSNQKILEKVRDVDPKGDRTLGIITKPDGLAADSGAEKSFIELAQNKDIFFKLGWHVLKNRKFEEREFNLMERNFSETTFFRTSNFKCLPPECVGIDSLRNRLSLLLFDHVKLELPKLKHDLEKALSEARGQLEVMGVARSLPAECKTYLAQLSLAYHNICSAAINGHYEGEYFRLDVDATFNLNSASTIRRTRAVVQSLNSKFEQEMRASGRLYDIDAALDSQAQDTFTNTLAKNVDSSKIQKLSKDEALDWVRQVIVRTRGKELMGNFNPIVVAELFWDQSSKWGQLAEDHVERVAEICSRFLKTLLQDKCPKDVESRLWPTIIEEALNTRLVDALKYLKVLVKELKQHPINYTETITARRRERHKEILAKAVEDATTRQNICTNESEIVCSQSIDVEAVINESFGQTDTNMENFSCEEALDCLHAIYKVRLLELPLQQAPTNTHLIGSREAVGCERHHSSR
jgi:GTPase SAR1 family protein